MSQWPMVGNTKTEKELKKRYPDSPWKHRNDWALGSVKYNALASVLFVWGLAAVVLALAAPGTLAIPEELDKGNEGILVVLIFVLMGLAIVYQAIVLTLRWRRFGNSELKFITETGVLGGEFKGRIRGSKNVPSDSIFEIVIKNFQQKTVGSGKNRRVIKNVLYEQRKSLPARSFNLLSGVPVEFHIPFDCRESDYSDREEKYLWEIEVAVDVQGANFDAHYEIPVFSTSESDPSLTRERVKKLEPDNYDNFKPVYPQSKGLYCEEHGKSFVISFSAARDKSKCIWLSVTFCMMLLVVYAIWEEVPIFFTSFIGLFACFVLYGVLVSWLHSRRVVVKPTELLVIDSFLGCRKSKLYSNQDIVEFVTRMAANTSQNPKYVSILKIQGGKEVQVTEPLPDLREAEWLTSQMQRYRDGQKNRV